MRPLREHLSFANVTSVLALVVALGGTTAWAVDGPLAGQNTVGSEDIIGNEVKSDDIGNGRIFNLDIADEIITGAKLKNGTVKTADIGAGSVWGQNLDISPDTYRRESTVGPGTARDDGSFSDSKACDAGDTLLSGGPANMHTTTDMVESFPSGSHAWTVRVQKNGVDDNWNVVVLCLNEW